ncbi:MAG: PEP-CTERM sorting domain-containing protein [Gemmataceae bacterium]|nr:PEP-CTERM sorting domain-containing protein [Gemmataceae bacterium]
MTPATALLPAPDPGPFRFGIPLLPGAVGLGRSRPLFIDPIVAVGYDYTVTGGPLFASVLLPTGIGDGAYTLDLLNGSPLISLLGGTPYSFASPVDRFRVLGIETSAGLDPNNPNAFVTGLTFAGDGTADVAMTPLTRNTDVATSPEPGSMALLLLGTLGLAVGYRARCRKEPS